MSKVSTIFMTWKYLQAVNLICEKIALEWDCGRKLKLSQQNDDMYWIWLKQFNWPRICFVCGNHDPVISSFRTHHRFCDKNNRTGIISGAETVNPTGAPEFHPRFSVGFVLPIFCFLCKSFAVCPFNHCVDCLIFTHSDKSFVVFKLHTSLTCKLVMIS